MAFLGSLLQLVLLLVVPTTVLGLLILPLYRLFCYAVGMESGRRLLLFLHVPFTPLRELAHLLAATLFGHQVTNYRLLQLRAPDGELGFVEHSYRRNPLTALGNFFFALWPALGVTLMALLALRLLLPEVYASVSASTATLGTAMGIGDVFAAIGALFSGIFADFQYRLAPKLLFLLIAALLCLGAYVALEDLLHAVSGGVVFAAVVACFTLLCGLLDPRLSRVLLFGVRWFGVMTLCLQLLLLLLAVGMLVLGTVFFLARLLFGLDRRYWRRYYAAEDAAAAHAMSETAEVAATPGDDDAPPENDEIIWR